jgi:hypothetical protein
MTQDAKPRIRFLDRGAGGLSMARGDSYGFALMHVTSLPA